MNEITKEDQELVESIERLGNLFGQATELANNIRLQIKGKYDYHGYNIDILSMCRSLVLAQKNYEDFHTHFLKKLKEIDLKNG